MCWSSTRSSPTAGSSATREAHRDSTFIPHTRGRMMADFEYGPVELFLIGFSGERPGPEVVDAIDALVRSGTVNLLDLLFATRSKEGELTVIELDEVADEYGLSSLEAVELGLAGEEDIAELAEAIEPGT